MRAIFASSMKAFLCLALGVLIIYFPFLYKDTTSYTSIQGSALTQAWFSMDNRNQVFERL